MCRLLSSLIAAGVVIPLSLSCAAPELYVLVPAGSERLVGGQGYNLYSGATWQPLLAVVADVDGELNVQADLLQISTSLAVPVRKDIPVAERLQVAAGQPKSIEFKLEIPNVKSVASFLLRLRWSQSDKRGVFRDSLAITVYPPRTSCLEETAKLVAALGQRKGGRVTVFGAENAFRGFLAESHAEYEDLGESVPDRWEPDCFYLGSGSLREIEEVFEGRHGRLPDRPCLAMLVRDLPDLLPGVYSSTGAPAGAVLEKVNLPGLKQLNDPGAHATVNRLLSSWLNRMP